MQLPVSAVGRMFYVNRLIIVVCRKRWEQTLAHTHTDEDEVEPSLVLIISVEVKSISVLMIT